MEPTSGRPAILAGLSDSCSARPTARRRGDGRGQTTVLGSARWLSRRDDQSLVTMSALFGTMVAEPTPTLFGDSDA